MKKILKKLGIIAIACVCMISVVQPVLAATYSVSASATSIYTGQSTTVYVGGSVTGYVQISASNATLSTSSVWVENNTQSITVTPRSAGSTVVTFTPSGNDGLVGSDYTTTFDVKNITINVSNKPSVPNPGTPTPPPAEEQGVDLSLASLEVSQGELSPNFSSENLLYNVDVASDVEEIEINAKQVAPEATLSGTGNHKLVDKDNKIEITVSDEKGNTNVYIVNVYKEPKPSVFHDYGSKELGVVSLDKAPRLTGFEIVEISRDDKKFDAYHNTLNDLYVLYMINEDGEKLFYLYDIKKEKITSKYVPVVILGTSYAVVDVPKKIQEKEGFKFTTIIVEDAEYEGLAYEDKNFKNYSLIYLMDETGDTNLYQYESSKKTLQLFSQSAPLMQEDYEKMVKDNQVLLIVASVFGVLTLLSVLSCIGLLVNKNNLRKKERSAKIASRNESLFESVAEEKK